MGNNEAICGTVHNAPALKRISGVAAWRLDSLQKEHWARKEKVRSTLKSGRSEPDSPYQRAKLECQGHGYL